MQWILILLGKKWFQRIILAILIFSSILLNIHFLKTIQKKEKDIERWKANYLAKDVLVTKITKRLADYDYQIQTIQLEKREWGDMLRRKDSLIGGMQKELDKLQIRLKNLQQITSIQLQTSNQNVTKIDTIIIEKKVYENITVSDSNLFFHAYWLKKDSVVWNYKYTEQLYYWTEMKPTLYNTHGKRRAKIWVLLFPKKQPVTFIRSTNSRSTLQAIQLKLKEKRE